MPLAPLFTDIAEAPEGGFARCISVSGDIRVRFALWRGDGRGVAFIFPGRTECVEKYGRMVTKLTDRGFDVVVIDWRGQGLAYHVDGRRDIGHVEEFTDYQKDLEAVLAHEDISALTGPRYLFAHSMGGCIALRTLIEQRGDFKAAVLSAPMWELTAPKGAKPVMRIAAFLAPLLGLGKKHVPSTTAAFYLTTEPFEGNTLTTDRDHWDYMANQVKVKPELGLGGPTLRWLRGAMGEFSWFKDAKMPTLPILMFVGGQEEIVCPDTIRSHAEILPDCKLVEFPASRHEIWMETPDIQQKAWDETDEFLQRIEAGA